VRQDHFTSILPQSSPRIGHPIGVRGRAPRVNQGARGDCRFGRWRVVLPVLPGRSRVTAGLAKPLQRAASIRLLPSRGGIALVRLGQYQHAVRRGELRAGQRHRSTPDSWLSSIGWRLPRLPGRHRGQLPGPHRKRRRERRSPKRPPANSLNYPDRAPLADLRTGQADQRTVFGDRTEQPVRAVAG